MIELTGLTKKFPKSKFPAVDDASLEINDGEIMGFAGLNGAGKTTTMRVIAGVLLPSSGKVLANGHDIVKDKIAASRTIAWVPESPNFEPDSKPAPLLRYYAGFFGVSGNEARERVDKALETVGLAQYTKKKLKNYSQGMKKRFSLAVSLVAERQNYLFDETLNGLDPEGLQFLRKLILGLKKEGKAVFLSSHILSELENLADRVAIIHRGKIVSVTTPDQLANTKSETVKVVVANPDDKLRSLLAEYGSLEIRGGSITIRNFTGKTSAVNRMLLDKGYDVRNFSSEASLEDYFFSQVGEAK